MMFTVMSMLQIRVHVVDLTFVTESAAYLITSMSQYQNMVITWRHYYG